MAVEKDGDITTESQNVLEDGSAIQVEIQTATAAAFDEAVEVYGDIATAEELGYVKRGYMDPWRHACHLSRYC